jgi:hypothetical protein
MEKWGKTWLVKNLQIFIFIIGYGVLIMKDGGRYEGEFVDGEINGKGERKWADGTSYKGEF